jgi:hypothetical protein
MVAHTKHVLRQEVWDFFTEHFGPGRVGMIGTKDAIGIAIREAQRNLTADRRISRWSHCFIMGDLRRDRRGPGRQLTQSPYIFESDLHVEIDQMQMRNGAQENWLGKWCRESVEHAAVIDFLVPPEVVESVLATALQLVGDQLRYSVAQLLGTWFSMVRAQRWIPNALADEHSLYCSAFVRHCYMEADADFLLEDISLTHTTPEDVARAGEAGGHLILM